MDKNGYPILDILNGNNSNESCCCSSTSNCCDTTQKKGKKVLIEYLYLDLVTCNRCVGTDKVLDEVIA